MNSVLQEERECYVCCKKTVLHTHHVFGGPNRKWSEEFGFKVYLCPAHHNMSDEGVHFNKKLDEKLKRTAQRYFESHNGSREDFINIFIRSYL